jgi:hypothetical protein
MPSPAPAPKPDSRHAGHRAGIASALADVPATPASIEDSLTASGRIEANSPTAEAAPTHQIAAATSLTTETASPTGVSATITAEPTPKSGQPDFSRRRPCHDSLESGSPRPLSRAEIKKHCAPGAAANRERSIRC